MKNTCYLCSTLNEKLSNSKHWEEFNISDGHKQLLIMNNLFQIKTKTCSFTQKKRSNFRNFLMIGHEF